MNIESLCFFISFTHLVTFNWTQKHVDLSVWVLILDQSCPPTLSPVLGVCGGGGGWQYKRASGVIKTIEVCL